VSTIQRLQLDRQAHDACALLAQAQYQLLVLRERQLQEADRECEVYAEGERKVEIQAEAVADRITSIAQFNALGIHGTALEQLDRIAGLIDAYAKQHHEWQQEIARLRVELEQARPPQQNNAPVPNELPFDAAKIAPIMVGALAHRVIGVDLSDDDLMPWLAAIVMRGYDEHARRYGKLIEIAIMGERISGGALYSTEAERAIATEADKHVDPGAPPPGWVAPDARGNVALDHGIVT